MSGDNSSIGDNSRGDPCRRTAHRLGLRLGSDFRAQENPEYQVISNSAQGAPETFGVKSISVLAAKS